MIILDPQNVGKIELNYKFIVFFFLSFNSYFYLDFILCVFSGAIGRSILSN